LIQRPDKWAIEVISTKVSIDNITSDVVINVSLPGGRQLEISIEETVLADIAANQNQVASTGVQAEYSWISKDAIVRALKEAHPTTFNDTYAALVFLSEAVRITTNGKLRESWMVAFKLMRFIYKTASNMRCKWGSTCCRTHCNRLERCRSPRITIFGSSVLKTGR
jgi:hypothetical protein